MGKYLDVWDVTAEHPKARAELEELRKGAERYEKIRKMTPRQFTDLFIENVVTGAMFDDLVDEFKFDA